MFQRYSRPLQLARSAVLVDDRLGDAYIPIQEVAMVLDAEEERRFTRERLDKMPVVAKGRTLSEWAGPDGGDLVVDTLDGGRFWIQYAHNHGIYRCAAKENGPAAPFERQWRKAE